MCMCMCAICMCVCAHVDGDVKCICEQTLEIDIEYFPQPLSNFLLLKWRFLTESEAHGSGDKLATELPGSVPRPPLSDTAEAQGMLGFLH